MATTDQSEITATLNQLNKDIAAAEAVIAGAATDPDELRELLDQQYKFLRSVSKAAINVLSETRAEQAAADFSNANSLISEILYYLNTYEVVDGPGIDGPDTNEFEPGPSGNSVKTITREQSFFELDQH